MEASAAARYIGCVDAILAAGLYWYALHDVAHKTDEALATGFEIVHRYVTVHPLTGCAGHSPVGTGLEEYEHVQPSEAGPQILYAPHLSDLQSLLSALNELPPTGRGSASTPSWWIAAHRIGGWPCVRL